MYEYLSKEEKIKSFGEVFTPDSVVNNMLDLCDKHFSDPVIEDSTSEHDEGTGAVAPKTTHVEITPAEYIARTYLEPSCGDGQFLVRILYRKLKAITEIAGISNNQKMLDYYVINAISSIYAVDIQKDNVKKAKTRLKNLLAGLPVESFDLDDKKVSITSPLVEAQLTYSQAAKNLCESIIERNVICDDTLKKGFEAPEFIHYDMKFDENTSQIVIVLSSFQVSTPNYEYNHTDNISDQQIYDGSLADTINNFGISNLSSEELLAMI